MLTPGDAQVLVASNRGPLSHVAAADGGLSLRRAAGGMVSAIAGHRGPLTWVCAALSDADRMAARAGDGRLTVPDDPDRRVRMLDLDRLTFDRAYNGVANRTLWFVAHLLFDMAHAPTFGPAWSADWAAYEHYCTRFADALAEEAAPGASVLVQDYHLVLVPALLRARRPDLRIAHFTHTPWAGPDYFRLLPDPVARAVLTGMLGADRLGFHSGRWAQAFLACCADVLGARVGGGPAGAEVTYEGRVTCVDVDPLGVDGDELRQRAAQPDVRHRTELLAEQAAGRRLLLRVDRTELSKNIVRGLEAYRELLRAHPELHGEVVHLAFAYPSRHDLPEYREYTAAVQRIAYDIGEEFGRPGWEPVRLEVSDDFPRSLAAYALADVLVVNPVRDGMNLVAKEGPVLSANDLALVLSREAGAVDELGGDALVVNPFDVTQTASAMWQGLTMDGSERRERCDRLAGRAVALPPAQWFAGQLARL